MFIKLAIKSLWDRKGSTLLAVLTLTVSIFVLLGVEHIRQQSKESFSSTVSGTDLIVGARTGSLNLLLYSVFRLGAPTNNITWQTYENIANSRSVKWAIPLSLGDSHKGFRVLGTNQGYFEHYRYGKKQTLEFSEGKPFNNILQVVLGAQVAVQLNYKLGDRLVLSHGIAATSFTKHDDKPFTVIGILAPTGTPVDQTLHTSLESIEVIHTNNATKADLQPKSITAFMLGLESKLATFKVQRQINQYSGEPLLAILPGVALSELWQMLGFLEKTLQLFSALVFFAAGVGLSAMLLTSIRERRHEIQLLRMIGAPAHYLLLLIQLEALLITLASCALGIALLTLTLLGLNDYLAQHFGLHIESLVVTPNSLMLLVGVLLTANLISLIPSISGYLKAKQS